MRTLVRTLLFIQWDRGHEIEVGWTF